MFTNSIVLENLLLVALDGNPLYLPSALNQLVKALEEFQGSLVSFKSFLNTIIPPLLIISGLSTGGRS